MVYLFNIANHVKKGLPPFLRKSKFLAFLETLLQPLATLNTSFKAYADESRYLANMTGQTILIEKYLNDNLDNSQRRIKVLHQQSGAVFIGSKEFNESPEFIGLKSEGEQSLYFELRGEVSSSFITDFRVTAPVSISADNIVGLVNNYKIAGKTFDIISN